MEETFVSIYGHTGHVLIEYLTNLNFSSILQIANILFKH